MTIYHVSDVFLYKIIVVSNSDDILAFRLQRISLIYVFMMKVLSSVQREAPGKQETGSLEASGSSCYSLKKILLQ